MFYSCWTTGNNALTILFAACEHRDSAGNLMMAEMTRLRYGAWYGCMSNRRIPIGLSMCSRCLPRHTHPHPIPQPLKTPPLIRLQIFKLLTSLGQDLADLTPRRFLRHTTVCAYLREHLPHIRSPSLSDLHVSLSNREHLRAYIDKARVKAFPQKAQAGKVQYIVSFPSHRQFTHAIIPALQSLLPHLKKRETRSSPSTRKYVRYAAELPSLDAIVHDGYQRIPEMISFA